MTGGLKGRAKIFLGENCSVCQSAISIDTIAANHTANVYESNICNAEPQGAFEIISNNRCFSRSEGKNEGFIRQEVPLPMDL